jgi:hypothetical protein
MLYLILSILSILGAMMNDFSVMSLLFNTIFVLIWTWFLNFLCSKGYGGISWFLVLLPFIMIIVIIVLGIEFLKKAGKNEKFYVVKPDKDV